MTRWFILSLTLTVLAFLAAIALGWIWPTVLQERFPMHWDINMRPDGWVTREQFRPYLLMFPGVMGLLVLLMWLLPMISPRNFEVERFSNTWGYVFTLLVAFFGYLFALQIWVATQEDAGQSTWFGRLFVAGFFVLFALLSNVIGKVQRNFWMGVRTPWTLASEAVWVRTHRLAAWTWMPMGILGAVLVLIGVPYWIAGVLLIVGVVWPAVYSLILYKRLQREGRL
jgi:uncharacterized membrane protein